MRSALVPGITMLAALLLGGCFSPVGPPDDGGSAGSDESGEPVITPQEAPMTSLSGQVVIDDVPDYGSFITGTVDFRAIPGGQTSTKSYGTTSLDGAGSFTFNPMPTAVLSREGWNIEQFPLTRQYRFAPTDLGEIGTSEVAGITISDPDAVFLTTHLLLVEYTYFNQDTEGPVAVSFNSAFGTADGAVTEYWVYVDRDVNITGTGTATGLDPDAGFSKREFNVQIDLLLKTGWNRATSIKVDGDSFRWYTGDPYPDGDWRK